MIAVYIILWLACGAVAAGWSFADEKRDKPLTHYGPFLGSMIMLVLGPVSVAAGIFIRLLTGKSHGWEMPRYTRQHHRKLFWFRKPNKDLGPPKLRPKPKPRPRAIPEIVTESWIVMTLHGWFPDNDGIVDTEDLIDILHGSNIKLELIHKLGNNMVAQGIKAFKPVQRGKDETK